CCMGRIATRALEEVGHHPHLRERPRRQGRRASDGHESLEIVRPSGTISADAVGEEPPFASAPVEDLMRLLGKAIRAHQLYLPNNPVYKSSIDQTRAAFAPLWDLTDELSLRFTESEIRWYGKPVLIESA